MSENRSLADPATTAETERVRRIWEKEAPRYDKHIGFMEKLLFGDGREWVTEHARYTSGPDYALPQNGQRIGAAWNGSK